MRDTDHLRAEKSVGTVVDRLIEEIVVTYRAARGGSADLIRWLDVDAGEYHACVDRLLRGWYGVGGPPEIYRLVTAARGAGYRADRCARFIGARFGLEELPKRGVWTARAEDASADDAPIRGSVIERQLELLLPIPVRAERCADAQRA